MPLTRMISEIWFRSVMLFGEHLYTARYPAVKRILHFRSSVEEANNFGPSHSRIFKEVWISAAELSNDTHSALRLFLSLIRQSLSFTHPKEHRDVK